MKATMILGALAFLAAAPATAQRDGERIHKQNPMFESDMPSGGSASARASASETRRARNAAALNQLQSNLMQLYSQQQAEQQARNSAAAQRDASSDEEEPLEEPYARN